MINIELLEEECEHCIEYRKNNPHKISYDPWCSCVYGNKLTKLGRELVDFIERHLEKRGYRNEY